MRGQILEIFTSEQESGEMVSQGSAELAEGRGIIGDRYCDTDPDDQVTLVDADAIAEVNAVTGWSLTPRDTRRNIVTTGIDLNQWETSRFRVGGAILEGVELCEPCASLGGLLKNETRSSADIVRALTHRCGLRARVVQGAVVSVGDEVEP